MSIAKNYVYNLILTISNIIIPFITIPYITRVLNPEGIGAVAFTGSIVECFVMFSALGITLYGPREIASVRDNPEKLRDTFWNIQYTKILTVLASYLAFIIFTLFSQENTELYI